MKLYLSHRIPKDAFRPAAKFTLVECHALLHQLERQRRRRPAEAFEQLIKSLRRAVAVQFDPVQAIVKVEEMAVHLPAAAFMVAGDDEEAVRLGVEALEFGQRRVSLIKRDRKRRVKDRRRRTPGAGRPTSFP